MKSPYLSKKEKKQIREKIDGVKEMLEQVKERLKQQKDEISDLPRPPKEHEGKDNT